MSAAGELGAFVTRDEARRLASALRMGAGLVHNAVKVVDAHRRSQTQALVHGLSLELGDPEAVAAVLDALAGVEHVSRPDLVWTSPSLPGAEGHTTLAASELVNEAQSHVFAATFTATKGSSYMTALANAVSRGVKVTLVLDRGKQRAYFEKTGWRVQFALSGARIWTLCPADPDVYAIQHAKLVMVDGLACLVTSANFSEAAAEGNLECGVLMRDRRVAASIKSHLLSLYEHGHLVDYVA